MRGLLAGLGLACALSAQPPVGSRPFRLDELKTPPGFEVSVYARVTGGPRHMAFGPNGALYVAARGAGTLVAIPERDRVVIAARGLNGPHSLVWRGADLYVAQNDSVLRFRDAVTADFVVRSQPERILSLPDGGGHSTRTLGFGPDGRIYATAGSSCNFCIESDPRRAAMMRYEADGSGEIVFARGLRNTVGFAWHPETGELWGVDNGGDGLGEDEPPDEINVISENGDYGWPDCIGRRRAVRWGAQARPERCAATQEPEFEMQAHSAPLGIAFYRGDQFPSSWRNDALVAFHGSWNRNEPTGYKVVRVRAAGGRATGVEDFLWGFLNLGTRTASGRPVQAIPGPDGSVYISDDSTGNIYLVRYTGPRINPGGIVRASGRAYEMYGTNLAGDPALVSVAANGLSAELLYASAMQVNFLLPEGLAGDVRIAVKNEKAADEAVITVE